MHGCFVIVQHSPKIPIKARLLMMHAEKNSLFVYQTLILLNILNGLVHLFREKFSKYIDYIVNSADHISLQDCAG
jgi:hypothetical protein